MSTAFYLKLTNTDYFKGFPQAKSYLSAISENSNGFLLMCRIVDLIHRHLRQEKGGIHTSIPPPKYTNVADNSIYTYLDRYRKCLVYESLSPKYRAYNIVEQVMFILNTLHHDSRLKPRIDHVETTIKAYQ